MNLAPIRNAIQIDSLDQETRNALWNLILPFLSTAMRAYGSTITMDIWTGLYHQATDTHPDTYRPQEYDVQQVELFYRFFREKVIKDEWHNCLSFIEFLAETAHREKWNAQLGGAYGTPHVVRAPLPKDYNAVFQQYMVGYRIIHEQIAPITDENEIVSIEEATQQSPDAVVEQLDKALRFLSDRKKPDYAKSVQCSISAVEAQCRILTNNNTQTLGQALKELENKGIALHGALKSGFEKLYGFTSDAAGIRHASINPSDVDFDLAKFMLVACSAFVNYLRSKGV